MQLRAPKSREGYEAIGGGSPLRRITEEQAEALRAALQRKGVDAHTYVAMRYWFPFTGVRGCRLVSHAASCGCWPAWHRAAVERERKQESLYSWPSCNQTATHMEARVEPRCLKGRLLPRQQLAPAALEDSW